MKLALISLSKEDPEGGGPIGLLPLFDSMLVDRQVRTAIRIGAEKIIFLCPIIPGAILQFMDQLKTEGIDAEIVRTARELVQYSSDDDQLLIMGDGILPAREIESSLEEQKNEILYVVENDDVFEDFERIDLNQRWVGLAQLKASRLSMMIDVPDDWNVGSALLRIAVQSECSRELISNPNMVSGAVVHLENGSETAEYTRRKLKEPGLAKDGLLERFILWPLTRRILPRLWKIDNSPFYFRLGALASAAVAAVTAYFQIPVASLALMVLSVILVAMCRDMKILADVPKRYFSDVPEELNLLETSANILSKIAMIILVISASQPAAIASNIIILIILWVAETSRQILPEPPKFRVFNLGAILPLLLLMLLQPFGFFLFGIYAIAIGGALSLAISSIYLARDLKNGA